MIALLVVLVAALSIVVFAFTQRLFRASLLEGLGTGLLLIAGSLTLAMLVPGFLGRLHAASLSFALLGLTGAFAVAARFIGPGETFGTREPGDGRRPVGFLRLGVAVLAGVAAAGALIGHVMSEGELHIDVLQFEVPNVLIFLREQTLWNYDGWVMYYPYGYGLLLAWGLVLGENLGTLYLLHLLSIAGVGVYATLILRDLLDDRSPRVRAFATSGLVVSLYLLSLESRHFTNVAKNDTFLAFCTLAAIYHFMRCWFFDGRNRTAHVACVGLALGLAVGAKVSAMFWLVGLSVAHVGLAILQDRRTRGATRRLACDAFLVALPAVIFGAGWILRTYLEFGLDPAPQKFTLAVGNSIANLCRLPLLWGDVSAWLPLLGSVVLGSLLLVSPGQTLGRVRRMLGCVLVATALVGVLATPLHDGAKLGSLVVCGLFLTAICFGRLVNDAVIDRRIVFVALCGMAGFAVLVVTPYSAWTGAANYVDPHFVRINYRYFAAGFPLVMVVFLAVAVRSLAAQSNGERAAVPASSLARCAVRGVAVVLAIVAVGAICTVVFSSRLDVPDTFATAEEHLRARKDPPAVFSWVGQNVEGDSILAAGLLPLGFSGRGLSNHVDYSLAANRRLLHWSRWDLDDVVAEIDRRDVGYLAVARNRTEQPPPNGFSEDQLASMRETFELVFEDAYSSVFATRHARRPPPPEAIEYDFATLAGRDLYGGGWERPRKISGETTARTNRDPAPYLVVRVRPPAPGHDLMLEFRVIPTAQAKSKSVIRVSVNHVATNLVAEVQADGATIYRAVVPQTAWTEVESALRVDFAVASPQGADTGSSEAGNRSNRVSFDWLRFAPVVR